MSSLTPQEELDAFYEWYKHKGELDEEEKEELERILKNLEKENKGE